VYVGTILILRVAARAANPQARRWKLAVAMIAIIAAGFTALRLSGSEALAFELSFGRVVVLALDMWLVLRLISFVWESGAGKIKDHGALEYAAWALNPFTLIGPVLRFTEFGSKAIAGGDPHPTFRWQRLLFGAFQMAAGYALSVANFVLADTPLLPKALKFGLWALLFGPWAFYLTIAGFFKVMEVCALAWGITIPPSFDRAFGQTNLADFWARWNMTATRLFRDCAFYVRWGLQRPNVYLNTMILFVLVGLWHAANAYWILWGTLHGLGFCVYLVFRRFGEPLRTRFAWIPEKVRSALAIATTYVFVCACWATPSWLIRQGSSLTAMMWRWIS
jgi:D-alanyl-lipoteichoic acid acyltransferase DltB (MBOAT superfamily)